MLQGEVKVNDLTLLQWQADNVHNTCVTPTVYEVTATGIDGGHRPFRYEFQILADGGYTAIATQVVAEVAERCDQAQAFRAAMPAGDVPAR